MAAGFRTRKIKSESSIGDRLKRARTRKKISVSQVEEATKIRARFISALESDSWEQIPSETHGRGYLEAYAQYLQLPVAEIMKQFNRERDLYARKCLESHIELAPKSRLVIPRFLVTPRFFLGVFGIMAFFVAAGTVATQIKAFSSTPFIETNVQNEISVTASNFQIHGRTSIGASVHINGQITQVNEDGSFEQVVDLQKGTNAVVIEAVNSQGKKTSEVLSVIAK